MKNKSLTMPLMFAAFMSAACAMGAAYEYPNTAQNFTFSDISDYIKTTYSQPDFAFNDTVDLTINSTYNGSSSALTGIGGLSFKSLTINGASRFQLQNSGTAKIAGAFTIDQRTQEWGSRIFGGNWEFDSINIVRDGTNANAGIANWRCGLRLYEQP